MVEPDISDLKGDVRVLRAELQNGQKETGRRLDRIESKIDAQANVPAAAFEEYKKDAKETYVTKDQFKPVVSDVAFLKKVLYSTISIILVAVITAGLGALL
jgi:hypothetical protein